MEVLVSGLNSYLGRASISYLQGEGYNVHGISRDIDLLSYTIKTPITASVTALDLFKGGKDMEGFRLASLDVAFYFTQIPDLSDRLGVQYELLSLRNFVLLSQRNGCNRVVYIGRTYDRGCLEDIKDLFVELKVIYTIVLKDVAVGAGTAFDRLLAKMMTHRYVFLLDRSDKPKFSPFLLKDIFRWIKKIPWKEAFLNDEIEFGGSRMLDVREFVVRHLNLLNSPRTHRVISVRNKHMARFLNRFVYGTQYDLSDEYMLNGSKGRFADNSKWQSLFSFDFTPLDGG